MGLFLLQVFLTALHFVLEFTKEETETFVRLRDYIANRTYALHV